ncbi:hypothetical protein Tco_0584996 [Tanacetum coccineum]
MRLPMRSMYLPLPVIHLRVEDASKQGRSMDAIDRDAEVTLVDETQGKNDENDDNLMFDTGVLDGDEVIVETEEPVVNAATTTKSIPISTANPVTTTGEVVTTTSVKIPDELTISLTLIEIKTAKPKVVTTATTTVTPVRPRAKGIVFNETGTTTNTKTIPSQSSQLPQAKDKGKEKMIKLEKPLKKKEQMALDAKLALRLHAEEQSELDRMQKERAAQE